MDSEALNLLLVNFHVTSAPFSTTLFPSTTFFSINMHDYSQLLQQWPFTASLPGSNTARKKHRPAGWVFGSLIKQTWKLRTTTISFNWRTFYARQIPTVQSGLRVNKPLLPYGSNNLLPPTQLAAGLPVESRQDGAAVCLLSAPSGSLRLSSQSTKRHFTLTERKPKELQSRSGQKQIPKRMKKEGKTSWIVI